MGDFPGIHHSLHGILLHQVLAGGGIPFLVHGKHGGVRHAGTDAVDADVFPGIVQGGAFGKAADRVLSGGIGGHGVLAPQAAAGGNIYHRSPAVFQHSGDFIFCSEENAEIIDGKCFLHFLRGIVRRLVKRRIDAGAVAVLYSPMKSVNLLYTF